MRNLANTPDRKIDRQYALLSFAFPTMVVLLTFLLMGIYPFGHTTILSMDLHSQYFPMIKSLREALRGGDFLYSFEAGLGFNRLAQTAYYTNSIFWYLLALLPESWLIPAFHLTVAVKFGLAGMTFSYYLRRKYGEASILTVVLSFAYALCGYAIAYIQQIMWADAVILLPVVLIGLEILLEERRPLTYIISLALVLLSNFYVGFGLCIFTALYFVVYELSVSRPIRRRLTRAGCFAVASLLAGGISSVVLIPTYLTIQGTKASAMGFGGVLKFYHSWEEIAENLTPFSGTELGYGVPNIYCGVFVLATVLLYAFNRRIPLRRRLLHLGLLAFLMLSFELNLLDYIWHGFHYPNQLPGRQSFVFAFLALVLTYETLRDLSGVSRGLALLSVAAPAVWLISLYGTDGQGSNLLLFGAVLLLGHGAVLLLPREFKKNAPPVLLACLMFFEVLTCSVWTLGTKVWTYDYGVYTAHFAEMESLTETYESGENQLWRTDSYPYLSFNSGQLYGHKGLSYYSSMMSGAAYDFFGNVGFGVYANNVSTLYAPSPVTNMLLNVKYVYDRYDSAALSTLTPIETVASTTVRENEYYLPFAFMVDGSMTSFAPEGEIDPFVYQNEMLKATGATTEDVFELFKGKKAVTNGIIQFGGDGKQYYSRTDSSKPVECTFTYTVKKRGDYFAASAFRGGTLRLYVNGEYVKDLSAGYGRTFFLGNYPAGTTVQLVLTGDYDYALYGMTCYRVNEDVLASAHKSLASGGVEITSMRSSSHIKATVHATKDGLLYTTLPHDGGWRLYVDGEKTELATVAGFLCCAPLTAGEHTLEFRYTPPGLYAGLALSLVCIALTAMPYLVLYLKKKRKTAPPAVEGTN